MSACGDVTRLHVKVAERLKVQARGMHVQCSALGAHARMHVCERPWLYGAVQGLVCVRTMRAYECIALKVAHPMVCHLLHMSTASPMAVAVDGSAWV